MDLSLHKKYRFWVIIIFLFIPILTCFPYVKTEILTSFFSSKSDFKDVCDSNFPKNSTQNNNSNLRYFKIIDLDFSRNNLQIYCIFDNSDQNVSLSLEKTTKTEEGKDDKWSIILTKKLNEKGYFYYPFYI